MNGYSLRIRSIDLKDGKTRQYVGVGATVSWIIILVLVGLIPAIRSAFQAQALTQSEKVVEIALLDNVAKIKQAQKLIDKARESESLVTAAVPFSKKQITVVNEIDLMVAKHGLAMDNLAIDGGGQGFSGTEGSVEPTEGLLSIGFTLGINGSYQGIRDLINEMENVPRLIKLQSVDISKGGSSSKSSGSGGTSEDAPVGELSATILGEFYYNSSDTSTTASVNGEGN